MAQPENLAHPPAPSGWMRVTRGLAAACLLLPLIPVAMIAFTQERARLSLQGVAEDGLAFLAFMSPLWLPALWILLRVRARPRRNLVLARSLGVVVFLCAVVVGLLSGLQQAEPTLLIFCGAYAGVHLALAVSAGRVYGQLPVERPPVRVWPAAALGAALPLAFMVVLILPELIVSRHPPSDSWAAGDLRSINTAAVIYESNFGGYPASLAVLGPPTEGTKPDCHAAGLIDSRLASRYKRNYAFVYAPGPPIDDPAPDCPAAVKGYTVDARPVEYGKPGHRSFFTDDSAVIRYTREDRPATPADPIFD